MPLDSKSRSSSRATNTAIRQEIGTPQRKSRNDSENKSFIGSHRYNEQQQRGSSQLKRTPNEKQPSVSGRKKRPKTTSRESKERKNDSASNSKQSNKKPSFVEGSFAQKDLSMALKFSSIKKAGAGGKGAEVCGGSNKNKSNTLFSVESYKGIQNQSIDRDVFREMIENAMAANMHHFHTQENPNNKSECSWMRQDCLNDTNLDEDLLRSRSFVETGAPPKKNVDKEAEYIQGLRESKVRKELTKLTQNFLNVSAINR
jgi:hypothetical protein